MGGTWCLAVADHDQTQWTISLRWLIAQQTLDLNCSSLHPENYSLVSKRHTFICKLHAFLFPFVIVLYFYIYYTCTLTSMSWCMFPIHVVCFLVNKFCNITNKKPRCRHDSPPYCLTADYLVLAIVAKAPPAVFEILGPERIGITT